MTREPAEPQTASSIEPFDPGSDRRRYYFDARVNATMVSVFQGDFFTSANPNEIITTVLGSCIAVCVRDPDIRFGGMNHFLLPNAAKGQSILPSRELRYGSYSIERLVNAILAHGGRRSRLEIKVFGGANLTQGSQAIGSENISFVEKYFEREGLVVAASDLGGNLPRRVRYYPVTGRAQVAQSQDGASFGVFAREQGLKENSSLLARHGRAELF